MPQLNEPRDKTGPGFPTRPDISQAVRPHKIAKGSKVSDSDRRGIALSV